MEQVESRGFFFLQKKRRPAQVMQDMRFADGFQHKNVRATRLGVVFLGILQSRRSKPIPMVEP